MKLLHVTEGCGQFLIPNNALKMSAVECSLEFSDGEQILKTGNLSGQGKEYYESLSTVLSQLKEETNSLLTIRVEKEKRQPAQIQKRPQEDDDGEGMC